MKLSKSKYQFYDALKEIPKEKVVHVLKHIDEKGIESICECVFNTIYTDLELSRPKQNVLRRAFSKKKKSVSILADKNNNFFKKKKAVVQVGSGIGVLLATVAPLLLQLLTRKRHT
jgi:hypothetical protein